MQWILGQKTSQSCAEIPYEIITKRSSLSLIKDNERWEVEEPVILKENVSDLVNHQKRTDFMPIGNKIDFSHAILTYFIAAPCTASNT